MVWWILHCLSCKETWPWIVILLDEFAYCSSKPYLPGYGNYLHTCAIHTGISHVLLPSPRRTRPLVISPNNKTPRIYHRWCFPYRCDGWLPAGVRLEAAHSRRRMNWEADTPGSWILAPSHAHTQLIPNLLMIHTYTYNNAQCLTCDSINHSPHSRGTFFFFSIYPVSLIFIKSSAFFTCSWHKGNWHSELLAQVLPQSKCPGNVAWCCITYRGSLETMCACVCILFFSNIMNIPDLLVLSLMSFVLIAFVITTLFSSTLTWVISWSRFLFPW